MLILLSPHRRLKAQRPGLGVVRVHRDHPAPRVQHGRGLGVPRHVDVGLELRVAHQTSMLFSC